MMEFLAVYLKLFLTTTLWSRCFSNKTLDFFWKENNNTVIELSLWFNLWSSQTENANRFVG